MQIKEYEKNLENIVLYNAAIHHLFNNKNIIRYKM